MLRFGFFARLLDIRLGWRAALETTIANHLFSWISPGVSIGEPVAAYVLVRHGVALEAAVVIAFAKLLTSIAFIFTATALLIAGGYGGYSYVGNRRGQLTSFNAETAFAEALVGYLKRLGPLTAKAFVGVAAIEHDIEPFDPENPVQGQEFGPKLVTELWVNMGASAWSSADLSWTSAHQTSAARLRTGYRVYGDVSLGLEAGLNANRMGEDARAGLFGRYAWDGGEFSLATGFSGRFLEDAQSLQDPYATVNWLTQF